MGRKREGGRPSGIVESVEQSPNAIAYKRTQNVLLFNPDLQAAIMHSRRDGHCVTDRDSRHTVPIPFSSPPRPGFSRPHLDITWQYQLQQQPSNNCHPTIQDPVSPPSLPNPTRFVLTQHKSPPPPQPGSPLKGKVGSWGLVAPRVQGMGVGIRRNKMGMRILGRRIATC
jgi:hypothetical protein